MNEDKADRLKSLKAMLSLADVDPTSVQNLNATYLDVLHKHFTRIINSMPDNQMGNWNIHYLKDVLAQYDEMISVTGAYKMNASAKDGEKHSLGISYEDTQVLVTTIPCDASNAKSRYFKNGYFPYFDNFYIKAQKNGIRRHVLNILFLFHGTDHGIHVALLPDRELCGFPPLANWPTDLMSEQELREVGLI